MGELKNLKHEEYVKNLVKSNFNQTKAYAETYPNSSYDAARSSAAVLTAKPSVRQRIMELLSTNEETTPERLVKSLSDDLNATKPMIVNKEVVYVRDNQVVLEAKKLLFKLFGMPSSGHAEIDARQVNFNVSSHSDAEIERFMEKITHLHDAFKIDSGAQTGEVTDIEPYLDEDDA